MTLDIASSAFMGGYRAALEGDGDADALVAVLLDLDVFSRPFAFEGGAMGCRILDERDGGKRTECFASSAEHKWQPLVRLGIGCALARLELDPPDDPLTLNGFGFQIGLMRGTARWREVGSSFHSEIGRGRALWFVSGGRADACARAIRDAALPGALWRGVGTACAFAGDPLAWAGRLLEIANGFEDDVSCGVQDAVELWCALEGVPPSRTNEVRWAIS